MGDTKKTRIPKHIAGVKLPKKVRKQANRALEALDQPMVRNLASVALAAAAAAAAKHADSAAAASAKPVGKPGDAVGDKSTSLPPRGEIGEIAAGLAMAAIAKWLSADNRPAKDGAEEATREA